MHTDLPIKFLLVAMLLLLPSSLLSKQDACLTGDQMHNIALYLDNDHSDIHTVIKKDDFVPNKASYINLGFDDETTIWIRLKLKNRCNVNINRMLVVNNPMLERIEFFNT